MTREGNIKFEILTDHVTYCIIDSTIYLFQNSEIYEDEIKIIYKKLSLLIEDNDISYINISAKKIEERKEFYQKMGFTLSYYDVNKLNILYKGKKNKKDYRCYGIMTKRDFFEKLEERKDDSLKDVKVIKSNSGFVSSMLLLFAGIALLCYFFVQGAIYMVK